MHRPQTVICRYRVKPGRERELEALLARHWPTLHAAGLVTDEPAVVYRAIASEGDRHAAPGTYVEVFSWRDAAAPGLAHELPDVMAVWEPMGAACEAMDFPHFERLDLSGA
ncbi:MAG: hypothetical protein KF729_25515 [Sandaracinaceae bacterium]|nr:hypothetical protein [Sandaracinaceae bacterium]